MRLWIVALVAGMLATPALAQAPPEAAAQAPQAASPTEPAQEEGAEEPESILEEELEERPDGYAYDSQGRRDPFVSLNKRIEGGERGPRPAGIEGFLIQELALKGVVRTPEGYISMLQGPDNKSYFVRLGQRVYDGAVVSIDDVSLTFRQDVTDPLSPVKTREVIKHLYPSEEARQ